LPSVPNVPVPFGDKTSNIDNHDRLSRASALVKRKARNRLAPFLNGLQNPFSCHSERLGTVGPPAGVAHTLPSMCAPVSDHAPRRVHEEQSLMFVSRRTPGDHEISGSAGILPAASVQSRCERRAGCPRSWISSKQYMRYQRSLSVWRRA
jgi:hypothetical protein